MEWADDVTNRPRRANAGSRLHELLERGLDADDERDLQQLDHSSSDTSFTLGSDEETVDEVDSDFDAEEVAGVLEGEAVETDATVRRAERQERQRERQKRLKRTQTFSKSAAHDRAVRRRQQQQRQKQQRQQSRKRGRGGEARGVGAASTSRSSDGDSADEEEAEEPVVDLRQRVRHRPAPTIPCAQRLAEAHDRAVARRAAQTAMEGEENGGADGAGAPPVPGLRMGKASPRSRRGAGALRRLGEVGGEAQGCEEGVAWGMVPCTVSPRIALYEGLSQRVGYASGVSVRERFHVDTVVSFSLGLPAAFRSGK